MSMLANCKCACLCLSLFSFASVVLLSGCSTPTALPEVAAGDDIRTFSLILDSDPSGADILWPHGSELRSIGAGPRRLDSRFEARPDNRIGTMGKRAWHPVRDRTTQGLVYEQDDTFVIRTPELTFQQDGYQPETHAFEWHLPRDFDQREPPIPPVRHERVVMRTPTQPRYSHTITVESIPTGAQLHQLGENGMIGPAVGSTPMTVTIDFAPHRAQDGRIVGWRRWSANSSGLWSYDKEGFMLLNGFLTHPDHKPERIHNHRVLHIPNDGLVNHRVTLEMLRPGKPQHQFVLGVDSLPSQAEVYVVQPDETLGERILQTPFEITIGLAQQLRREGGHLVHDDWLVWGPTTLLRWETGQDGSTRVYLACALYKEGFAVETPRAPILTLRPGQPFPESRKLTVPLLRPEQAAVREARQTAPVTSATSPPPHAPERRAFIWQAPETPARPGHGSTIVIDELPPPNQPSFWQRLRHGNTARQR